MTRKKKIINHIYTVELRFWGQNEQFDPDEISIQLGLQPSTVFPLKNSRVKQRSCWGYDGHGEVGFQLEWTTLEDGLKFLLNILEPRKKDILVLANQHEGVWWCGHFQSSFDGGPTLSPKLLTELGEYRMKLYIDNYFRKSHAAGHN